MNICSIGRQFSSAEVGIFQLDAPRTLLDFDIVIFDLALIPGSIEFRVASRRRTEILDLLKLGRTILVFLADF